MGLRQCTTRLTAWIACFSILLAAFAPSISHAVAARAPVAVGDICGAPGTIKAESAPAPHDGALHFKHCPFCSGHGGAIGMPPAIAVALPFAPQAAVLPSLLYGSPQPLFVWDQAQPRAPPVRA